MKKIIISILSLLMAVTAALDETYLLGTNLARELRRGGGGRGGRSRGGFRSARRGNRRPMSSTTRRYYGFHYYAYAGGPCLPKDLECIKEDTPGLNWLSFLLLCCFIFCCLMLCNCDMEGRETSSDKDTESQIQGKTKGFFWNSKSSNNEDLN